MRNYLIIEPTRKSVLMLLITLSLVGSSFSQQKTEQFVDSSIIKKVESWNALSNQLYSQEKKRLAKHYAELAYRVSEQNGYAHGAAFSLLRLTQIAKHFEDDFKQTESLAKKSLEWYNKTANKKGLDTLYFYLVFSVLSQSRYDEALDYANKLYAFGEETGNASALQDAMGWQYAIHRQRGDYENGFIAAENALEFAKSKNKKIWIAAALYGMAQLYSLIEDYQNSLLYFRRVLEMDDDETRSNRVATDNDIWFKMELAEVFSNLGQYDSAWHYYNLYKPGKGKEQYLRVYWVSTGECYYLQGQYQKALENFKLGLAEHQKLHDRNEVIRTLIDIGKTHLALSNNIEAIRYAREGLANAIETKTKQAIRNSYQILHTAYDRMGQEDSANYYFREYTRMKDVVLNDQGKGKIVAYAYEQRIESINKEKEIQQARLKDVAFIRNLLLAGLALIVLLGIAIFRAINLKRKNEKLSFQHNLELNKLENEKSKAELQQQAVELEMKALRSQMNPHFIFNSLNSINRFILENNKSEASIYLTKFSRLVRMILQNSQASEVTLETELETLDLYLQLESLRFAHRFSYSIVVEDDVDPGTTKVPPLIIQPYAENAIWHGLMMKSEKGHLGINIYKQDNLLHYRITDDGIGRKKAAELKSKSVSMQKSFGMKLTAERIRTLNAEKGMGGDHVKINDQVLPDGAPGGTEVIIKLPIEHASRNID